MDLSQWGEVTKTMAHLWFKDVVCGSLALWVGLRHDGMVRLWLPVAQEILAGGEEHRLQNVVSNRTNLATISFSLLSIRSIEFSRKEFYFRQVWSAKNEQHTEWEQLISFSLCFLLKMFSSCFLLLKFKQWKIVCGELMDAKIRASFGFRFVANKGNRKQKIQIELRFFFWKPLKQTNNLFGSSVEKIPSLVASVSQAETTRPDAFCCRDFVLLH